MQSGAERLKKIIRFILKEKANLAFLFLMFFLALYVRHFFLDFQSEDYQDYLLPWVAFIRANGGFAALKNLSADQSPVYLYLLALASYLPFSILHAVKFISIFFDFVLAAAVGLVVQHKYRNSKVSLAALAVVLFAPTVVTNSAIWGQCDAIYTSFLVLSVYFLLKSHNRWALVCYALAFSLKLQAIFLAPLFLILFLRKKIPWKEALIFPFIYLAMLLPGIFSGRPWEELLTVYLKQTDRYKKLSFNAPTFYQWLPANLARADNILPISLVFATVVIGFFVFYACKKLKNINGDQIITLALISATLVPFVLPRMHDRYFFPADIFSIVFAFYFPRYFYLPILMQLISYLSYQPFLYGGQVDFNYLTLGVLALILIVIFGTADTKKWFAGPA